MGQMTEFMACQIVEGLEPSKHDGQYTEAMQHLIDTGLVWQLQGWYGREAMRLIDTGQCSRAGESGWDSGLSD